MPGAGHGRRGGAVNRNKKAIVNRYPEALWRPYTQSDNYVYQFARGFGLIMICSPSPPDAMLVSPGDRGDSESPFSAYAIGVIPNHPFFAPGRTFLAG